MERDRSAVRKAETYLQEPCHAGLLPGCDVREGAEGKDEAYLKLYDGHDWKWFRVYLKRTDMEYLPRNWKGKKTSAPALEKRHRRYFLRFSCTEEVTLTKTPVKNRSSVVWTWESIPMRSVPLCGQTELSWGENLSIIPVKRPDVPNTGPNPKIPEGTQLCAVTGEDGHIRNA